MWALALQSTALLVLTFPLRWREELAADSRLSLCPFPLKRSQVTGWIHIPGAPASPARDKEKAECVGGGGLPCSAAENPTRFPILRLKKKPTNKEEPHPSEKVRRRKN